MGQWNSCEAQVFIVEEAQLEFDTPWMRFRWTIGKLQVAAADASFFFSLYRSSPSRSRPVPVSVPVSRPSSSSVTLRATSVSVSRPPRKSLPPSVPLSPLPSSPFSPSVVVTGAATLVSLTLCPLSRAPSVVPSPSEYVMKCAISGSESSMLTWNSLSPLPVVPALLPPPPLSVCSSLPVSRMPTPPLPAPPRPSRTPSRPPSLLSSTPTASLLLTSGRRLSSSAALLRSSVTSCARARSTRLLVP